MHKKKMFIIIMLFIACTLCVSLQPSQAKKKKSHNHSYNDYDDGWTYKDHKYHYKKCYHCSKKLLVKHSFSNLTNNNKTQKQICQYCYEVRTRTNKNKKWSKWTYRKAKKKEKDLCW